MQDSAGQGSAVPVEPQESAGLDSMVEAGSEQLEPAVLRQAVAAVAVAVGLELGLAWFPFQNKIGVGIRTPPANWRNAGNLDRAVHDGRRGDPQATEGHSGEEVSPACLVKSEISYSIRETVVRTCDERRGR